MKDKEQQNFSTIIRDVTKMYPEKKAKDISVPFCFICLLHLANERNLTIRNDESLSELYIE